MSDALDRLDLLDLDDDLDQDDRLLRDTVRKFADDRLRPNIQEWFEAGACDGFMVQVPHVPGGVQDFVEGVIQELQRRKVFREHYEGTTLRDHLGLHRPAA